MFLFVGIAFPDDVRLRLAGLCSGLPGAKWIDPENMHLTVRFIGEVGGAQAEDIDVALRRVVAPAFDLVVSGIDCFETGGKVHTLGPASRSSRCSCIFTVRSSRRWFAPAASRSGGSSSHTSPSRGFAAVAEAASDPSFRHTIT